MITKNILYQYFKDFADNHLQIKDYGYGDLWEISSSQATQYPLFWVSPQPSSISGNEITYNFNILIGDRLEDGDANKVEIECITSTRIWTTTSKLCHCIIFIATYKRCITYNS